eukprot:scaffold34954_cov76-Phaeocystis_antarctica.AAC.1
MPPPGRPPLRRHPNLRCHPNLRVASVLLLTVPRQCEMRANAKPAAAPGDGAPAYEDPDLIKNQRTKPGRAMPVRAHNGCRAVP